MRLKLFVVLVVALGYLAVLFACNTSSPTTALTQESNANAKAAANSNAATSNTSNTTAAANTAAPVADGANPPHAVDISGKAIPDASATQPDKPIILAKDSENAKPNSGELKPEAAFDHVKHSTLPQYSLDGKTVAACIDCHHTDQPSAPKGQEYLMKFERKEALTTKQLEASKEPVKSCRACHLQASAEETDDYPPKSVTYPKEMNRPPSGKLTNEIAYHLNCNTCHDVAKKRDPKLKAPQTCVDCHTSK
jgi:hypothetical protein